MMKAYNFFYTLLIYRPEKKRKKKSLQICIALKIAQKYHN